MSAGDKDRVSLGVISGVHGIKGEVKITSFTQSPADVAAYGPLEDEAGTKTFEIASARQAKGNQVVARLKGVNDRNAAEALKGVHLYVSRTLLPEPDAEEWYHADLIGLKAFSADGEPFGRVMTVQNFGAGDLLEIELPGGAKTVLLPFTKEAVPELDIKARRLTVSPPEGLLEDEEEEKE